MQLATLDYIIIIAFLLISLGIGLRFRKEAGKDISHFFLGGRNLPWWIAGISMVATTFAADTPLAVTELVAQSGIAGNWLWWNMLAGGMLSTFFFARYWRRANVLTDVELIELRYSGKPATFLRGFRSVYFGVFLNAIIIGWVNVALMSLLKIFFDIPDEHLIWYIAGAMLLVAAYSAMSGLLGVAFTDVLQFTIAMIGSIILAIVVLNSEEIGGVAGLKEKLPEGALAFFPKISSNNSVDVGNTLALGLGSFLAFITVQWWASWYPGSEPGGGGYTAQRMMSAKDEKHAVAATLFFQIAHYCLRPWPWIIVALCALVLYAPDKHIEDKEVLTTLAYLKESKEKDELGELYQNLPLIKQQVDQNPDLKASLTAGIKSTAALLEVWPQLQDWIKEDPERKKYLDFYYDSKLGYPMVMKDFLPVGIKGLLLVAFFAAYMSTISTQLNWGTSYLINDFYKRFLNPKANEKQFVMASRVGTILLMIVALIITSMIDNISGAWGFLVECGAGLGLVLILRWYWWRINAWSEIAASIAPFMAYGFSKFYLASIDPAWGKGLTEDPRSFFLTVGFTTVVWIVTTLLTKPTDHDKLKTFYDRIKPAGNWKPFLSGQEKGSSDLGKLAVCWISGVVLVYTALFTIGSLIFREWFELIIYFSLFALSFVVLRHFTNKVKIL
ncbi:MAG: sodium:solute symporter family protein [Bacteroidota bacterium]